jgi:hypothetical protein
VFFPWRLQKLFRREVVYSAFANRSLENQRRIADDLGAVQNYRKRAMGQLQGLQTAALWGEKNFVKDRNDGSPEAIILGAIIVAGSNTGIGRCNYYTYYDMVELGEAYNCRTFQIARSLVRLAYESVKPNDRRLKEYRDGALDSLKASLLADTPIYEDVEIMKLTDSLTMLGEVTQQVSSKHSPKEWATKLILGSKVRDVAERKRLIEGGIVAIEATDDEMIRFVLEMEPRIRDFRKSYEENFEAPLEKAYAELAQRRFAEHGMNVYPDATFTLRLTYGAVKGYKDDDGTAIAPMTNIAGMFERAEKQKFKEPFDPPKSWRDNLAGTPVNRLDMSVPFNLVSTNDIIGGNSGSPLINAKGEVAGCVFDGNIYSLSNNFVYTTEQSRCVSVHAAVIVESLRKIYGAEKLADELGK